MPSSGQDSSAFNPLDNRAGYMAPTFLMPGGQSGIGPHWKATECVLRAGVNPSTAICEIPLAAALDERAPSVAAIVGGPMDNIKEGTQCIIKGFFTADTKSPATTLLVGRVTGMDGNLDKDRLIIEVSDYRYDLEGCQVLGSWWAFPQQGQTSGASYRQGWPAIFNPKGMPNGLWCDIGGGTMVKLFCPPNYGLADGEVPPNPTDKTNTQKATYFTCFDKLSYFQFTQSDEAYQIIGTKFPFYSWVDPNQMTWNPKWCALITSDVSTQGQNSSAWGSQRKGTEQNCEGVPILAAIQEACLTEGPFAPFLYPAANNSYTSILTIVRTRLPNTNGANLTRLTSGSITQIDAQTVIGGSVRESAKNLYTKAGAGGNVVMIETLVTSNAGVQFPDPPTGLVWAFQQGIIDNFNADLVALFNTGQCQPRNADGTQGSGSAILITMAGVAKPAAGQPALTWTWYTVANELLLTQPYYQKLFAAWQIDPNYDFMKNTSEDGMPLSKISRPILPHLLTSMLQDAAALKTGGAATLYGSMFAFGQVLFESSPDGITWELMPAQDGFTIDADGTFWLRPLRDKIPPATYNVISSGVSPSIAFTINPLAIRASCVIPCDHRVEGGYKIASDPSQNLPVYQLKNVPSDANRIDPTLTRLHYVDARQLYQKWLRYNSYPQPQSVGGSLTTFPNRGGTSGTDPALRDDTGYLNTAVQRSLEDIGRIGKTGNLRLPYLSFTWQPGMAIASLGQWNIGAMAKEIIFSAAEDEKQYTEIGIT